jgi:rare lipoprotein A (peptidoglycan hydrolase)
MNRYVRTLVIIVAVLCMCYVSSKAQIVPTVTEVVFEKAPPYPGGEGKSIGVVSYYGKKWNGRTTANMEIYNSSDLTCASPSLPFNTLIEITNTSNNKCVIVRVNDRGPFKMDRYGKAIFPLVPHPKRVLDLSSHAFESIGDLRQGLLVVEFKIIEE